VLQRTGAVPRTAGTRPCPSTCLRYADWTLERIKREAGEIGPNASALVEIILREKRHPEQGFRSCLGIVRLAERFPRERVEAACERALAVGTRSFSSVKSILNTKLDRKRPEKAAEGPAIVHDNIRGPTFYH
jgi:transposase